MDFTQMHNASGTKPKFGNHNAKIRLHDCIQSCLRCHQVVMETIQYCIQQGGDHVDPHHMKLMQTCSEISRTSATFMMLQSPYHTLTCDLTAQICRECAKSCAGLNDDALNACSQTCLSCAETCEGITGAGT